MISQPPACVYADPDNPPLGTSRAERGHEEQTLRRRVGYVEELAEGAAARLEIAHDVRWTSAAADAFRSCVLDVAQRVRDVGLLASETHASVHDLSAVVQDAAELQSALRSQGGPADWWAR